MPLQHMFRRAWSKALWNQGAAGAQAAEDANRGGRTLNIETVDEAAGSQFFWAYGYVLNKVGHALLGLSHWAEGCPCHSGAPALRQPNDYQRGRAMQQMCGQSSCPLAGKRAPECAGGALLS
eukprot:1318252-Lingulodinium_polyedra.AAC.1